jgi:hypothetical protein
MLPTKGLAKKLADNTQHQLLFGYYAAAISMTS